MTTLSFGRAAAAILFAGLASISGAALPLAAEPIAIAKDRGPGNPACDTHAKDTPAWRACVGAASARMPDTELFYAGYWLAKMGRYQEALGYLMLAKFKDERVLTYIGFAIRKLGDVDGALPYYVEALAKNPGYSVARAYMGEAFLTKGEPEKARVELAEIEKRCGTACAEYADLAGHIGRYEAAHHKG